MKGMRKLSVLWLVALAPIVLCAGNVSGEYAGVSLADAIADIAGKSDSVKINFIYDKLDEYPVTCSFADATPVEALRQCIGFYPVNLRVSGNKVFVEAVHDGMPRFSGVVTDIHGHPVEYATIRIYNDADTSFVTGGVSNADGHFAIPVMPRPALVRVSSLGMRPLERRMTAAGTAVFAMETDPVVLRNIEVVSKNVYFDNNSVVIVPTKLEVAHSPDMFQLLMQQPVPGLYVDPLSQSLTVMNREPVILVDGIRRDAGYLRNLDPGKVAKIEYTTDVPQKYIDDAMPVGMLTITMKARSDGGNVRANVNQAVNAGFTMGGVSAIYNRGKSEFSVSYNLNRRDYSDITEESRSELHAPDFTIDIAGLSRGTMKRMSHNIGLGWTFKASQNLTVAVTARDAVADNSTTEHQLRRDSRQGEVRRFTSVDLRSHSPLLDVYLRYAPGDNDIVELQAITQVQNQDYDRQLSDTVADGTVERYPSEVGTHYNYVRFSGSWIHDFGQKVRFTLGENGYYARSRNIYRSIGTRYVNRELLNHISARFDFVAGNVNIGVGTGVRYVEQRNEAKQRRIVRNQSNMNLWLPIGRLFNFSFMASYFPGYPTLSAITEMPQDYDGYLISTGNASLKNPPVFNLQQQFNFNRGKWWAQLQLSQYMAHHLSYYTTVYAGDGRFLTRPENMNNNFDLKQALSVGARGLFGGHLTFNATVSHRYVTSDGSGWSFSRNMFDYSATATAYYSRCSLTAMVARNSGVFAMQEWKDTPTNRLIFDWTPLQGLNVQVGWWYVLNRDGNTSHDFNPVYTKYTRNRINDNYQMLTLGVSWNFNFGRKSSGPRRSLGIYGGSADTKLVQ